tara:strand:+ start:8333 stop:9490 length:1158 start_codon:yes stop_codon:yes gene_type:complete
LEKEIVEQVPWDSEPEVPEITPEHAGEVIDSLESAEPTEPEILPPTQIAKQELSLAEIMQLGTIAVNSNRFSGIHTSDQAIVQILAGRELGLSPMTALRNLYVVEGKVAMSAGLIASMVRKHPRYDYRIKKMDADECILEFIDSGSVVGESVFSLEDADRAGINRAKSGWSKYPRNMLFARALTNGARWYCPDAFEGSVYTPEELEPMSMSSNTETLPEYNAPSLQPVASTPVASSMGRPPYPATNDLDQIRNEPCPLHAAHAGSLSGARDGIVQFMKVGKMRSHAHPTGQRGSGAPWCSYEEVWTDCMREARENLKEAGYSDVEQRGVIEAEFPDLVDVPSSAYRIADWNAITDTEWTERTAPVEQGEFDAESFEDEAEPYSVR